MNVKELKESLNTARELNDRDFTVKELKDILNKFNDNDKINFCLWADATYGGGVIGELIIDVNDKTIFTVNIS